MVTVGARELKTRLGTYLRRVREGSVILVTERGRPVAELRPLPTAASDEEAKLLELAARGLVTLGTARLAPSIEPVPVRGGSVANTIVEERNDRC
ncbi:MAG: type II toxin-antitoxin system prevent-host-death family antitoxin [Holophagales bacterium]|nr:type II toxin-antitoxin system prevent-host-death family antitoxin [Holophagales bacterium]MXX60632.1 type II toxin-antitoxin system prevent-host-death family antitoxin [Holophagales bacterium]MYA09282.1 type II toxin-antitoxin system prevent-host-death family antitoxin [Holophagales bacterium]MYC09558.1 type II toxin-antitoxin system prevent-host-death family antitoxin [Holophagales bacterium]MYD23667.1 type II toxin-antitoxin system prevent-host-death family antitoxin [Holophagales bacteri